ncbi:ABC transporter permease [Lacrimispora sphenoides]|uniref:Simple sugar transport system permease protein n=1 Tax=Lacrimispora sphenoides JCM 1415 TaxID=1297793 RepID=A0ABY1CC35_9FIRM|nr:ABC transporter permease [Lacrimispora sphenoides]SET91274.1 simple sugar transport system permease protein [[Clostridium] sphenoides JCM 1415]SUY52294.1 inner-membrane translocator [Lacrimispora sphenoides]
MNVAVKSIQKILLTMLLALAIGALFILSIGENPLEAYGALLRGAFNGKLKIGTTLASFTPLLLTSCAFAVAAKAGAFNVGVEGEVFLGGITAAYIGINWTFLPAPVLLIVCFLGAMAVAALWALIPAVLKAYYRVSEVCVTILMNSVALYITSYLVSGPMSAGVANAQSLPVTVNLPQFMKPSSVNAGLFIALITVVLMIWVLNKTTFGYKVKTVGTNPSHAEYVGISPKKIFIQSMMLSGALGGMAGCIEVLGVHGYFLNNFAAGLGSNGMLASLIVKNNLAFAPFMSFFLAVLKSGAMGMQQSTGVPKSIVDTITAVFIIVATMELLFQFKNKKTKKEKSK